MVGVGGKKGPGWLAAVSQLALCRVVECMYAGTCGCAWEAAAAAGLRHAHFGSATVAGVHPARHCSSGPVLYCHWRVQEQQRPPAKADHPRNPLLWPCGAVCRGEELQG